MYTADVVNLIYKSDQFQSLPFQIAFNLLTLPIYSPSSPKTLITHLAFIPDSDIAGFSAPLSALHLSSSRNQEAPAAARSTCPDFAIWRLSLGLHKPLTSFSKFLYDTANYTTLHFGLLEIDHVTEALAQNSAHFPVQRSICAAINNAIKLLIFCFRFRLFRLLITPLSQIDCQFGQSS